MHRSRTIALAALLGGSLLLAACGDDDGSNAADEADGSEGHGDSETPVAEGAREVEVLAADFAFDPSEITAEAGDEIAIVLRSGDMVHDFTIDELDARVAAGEGETATGGLTVAEPGTYTYYCSVPGHRGAGMEGTLTVE